MRRLLVAAPRLPEHDREGGYRRIFFHVKTFVEAGWAVTYLADETTGQEMYAETLRRMGVDVYRRPEFPSERLAGSRFDLALLAFWYTAEGLLPAIRRASPQTKVLVDSVDLHFLRASRQALGVRGTGNATGVLDHAFGHEIVRELNTYARADRVITVSQKEADLVNDLVARQVAVSIPDTDDIGISTMPFSGRRGMVFVGNFRHLPNVRALHYLGQEILPRLDPQVLSEHPVYIVGNGLEPSMWKSSASSAGVRLAGWVPDIEPYLHHARVSLVPLLDGAGTKRKLVQSLLAGTPVVTTPIGAEGFELTPGRHLAVAEDPDTFARSVMRLLGDEDLWSSMADSGREWATKHHTSGAVRDSFWAFIDALLADDS